MLNVLLFAGRFEVRGSSAYTLRLAENLAEHDIAVRIACADASCVEATRRQALSIREYSYLEMPVWGRLITREIQRDVAENVPDVIHVHSRHVLAQGCRLARHLGCPCLLTVHDYLAPRERLRFDHRVCRGVIAVSRSVKADLVRRFGIPDQMVKVIHSGFDTAASDTSSSVLAADRVPVVGTAGPLEAVKGLTYFLNAAKIVHASRGDVAFLVAGSGPEEHNLRQLTHNLGLVEQVTFVPNLRDFSAPLEAMDIFCLPSLRQGLGTIMLDAMARGRPVIATGVGGVYSIIRDNETGLVVPPSDSSRLAERMLELLNDADRARAVGEAGRQFVRREFNVDKMVSQTAALYRKVAIDSPTNVAPAP